MSVQIQDEFKEKKNKVVVKVGMLGDSQIGKTTLMVKYIEDKYDEDYIETLGVNFMDKSIELKNVNVTMRIWELGGQKEFTTLMHSTVQRDSGTKIVLFAFDLTNKQSLFSVKRWYKDARKENKIFMPFLIGTKFDLFDELEDHHKQDITKQARKFAKKMHAPLIYCSSAQSINVKKIFKVIIAKVFDLKPKIKEAHDATKEALIEFDINEEHDLYVIDEENQNEKGSKKKDKKDKKKKKKDKKNAYSSDDDLKSDKFTNEEENNEKGKVSNTKQENKIVVKVGMLGDSQIGKTTLMVKYIEGKYDEDYI
eukprot:511208_1